MSAHREIISGVVLLWISLCSAVADNTNTYPLRDGSALTMNFIYADARGEYNLIYTRPDGPANVVWRSSDNSGSLALSAIWSAYVADGRITALFQNAPGEVFILQVPETPGKGEARMMAIPGLVRIGPFGHGDDLHLTDHNHFEIVNDHGEKKAVSVNLEQFFAAVDGKPVETLLMKDGKVIGRVPPHPEVFSRPDASKGSLDGHRPEE
jgi:hypothetical protein